jgi:hypothetical protein
MERRTGKTESDGRRRDFDRRLMLQFRRPVVTFDAGLLVYRELDDALGLTTTAVETLADARTEKNGRPALVGWLRQSVFGRSLDMRTSTTPSGSPRSGDVLDYRRQFGSHLKNIG